LATVLKLLSNVDVPLTDSFVSALFKSTISQVGIASDVRVSLVKLLLDRHSKWFTNQQLEELKRQLAQLQVDKTIEGDWASEVSERRRYIYICVLCY
jgi:hypothetical protein